MRWKSPSHLYREFHRESVSKKLKSRSSFAEVMIKYQSECYFWNTV